jgi:hypothetical protein
VQLRLNFRDQAVRHVETKFEDGVIEMVKIIHQFKAVIILRRHRLQRVVIAVESVGAALPAGDDFDIRQRLQMVDHGVEMVNRQLAVEDVFIAAHHPAAVFRHEGDLMGDLREEGDQLVILVAAGDHEANVLLAHSLILGEEARPVVSFGIA